jgi:hypothetical protein
VQGCAVFYPVSLSMRNLLFTVWPQDIEQGQVAFLWPLVALAFVCFQ